MSNQVVIPDPREGFSMQIEGVQLNRPDLNILAAELGVQAKDILFQNGVLTIYNTSEASQEIIDDNALVPFVAMTLEIAPESISELRAVKAPPKVLDRDDFLDDEDED